MSSLGELQEVAQLLREIDQMIGSIEGKTQTLEKDLPKIQGTIMTAQQALRIVWRFSSLMAHMGFPSNVQQMIRTFTQVTHAAVMAYYSINLLMSGTLYGAIAGLIGIGVVSVSAGSGSMLEGY